MLVLAITSIEAILVLAACTSGSDVALGADRHLDITFG